MGGRVCEIDINVMDAMQDPPGKQETCISERLRGSTSEKGQFYVTTSRTHDVVFPNTPFVNLLPTCQLFWIPKLRIGEKDGEEMLTIGHGRL